MMQKTITITVQPEYMKEHSHDGEYIFAYHICIRNIGDEAAQLLSRKWLITDADGHETKVQGDGVIGEQPVIQPQEEHCYSSFSILKTPVGCMQGSYGMQTASGVCFDAVIPVFTLAVEGVLH